VSLRERKGNVNLISIATHGCNSDVSAHTTCIREKHRACRAGSKVKEQNGSLARVNPLQRNALMTGCVYFQMRVISREIILTLQRLSCSILQYIYIHHVKLGACNQLIEINFCITEKLSKIKFQINEKSMI